MKREENKIAKRLFGMGWIIIVVGIICGFAFANVEVVDVDSSSLLNEYGLDRTTTESQFSWRVAITWWGIGLLGGLSFLGLGEIIYQLSEVNSRLYTLNRDLNKMGKEKGD